MQNSPENEGGRPRVTWLLPVKNGMPYLTETLASIEAQTYRNWEILVWDNGSTDGTLEELQRWIPSRLPGRVVMDRPLGLGAALAALVESSPTELCARIDADDVNLPERLEKQVAFLQAHPDVAVVGTQSYWMKEDGTNQGILYPRPRSSTEIALLQMTGSALSHPTVMFRRSRVIAAGNYLDIKPVEDYELWLRMLSRYQLANLDEPLIYYRVRETSVSQAAMSSNEIWEKMHDAFCKNSLETYGCSSKNARKLVKKSHPCSIVALLLILRHINQQKGQSAFKGIESAVFLDTAFGFTSRKDLISRFIIKMLRLLPQLQARGA